MQLLLIIYTTFMVWKKTVITLQDFYLLDSVAKEFIILCFPLETVDSVDEEILLEINCNTHKNIFQIFFQENPTETCRVESRTNGFFSEEITFNNFY